MTCPNRPVWRDDDTERALRFWRECQERHDGSALRGQAVGIDPRTGEVWFGESAKDVMLGRRNQGVETPLFFLTVGYGYYAWKVGKRVVRPSDSGRAVHG